MRNTPINIVFTSLQTYLALLFCCLFSTVLLAKKTTAQNLSQNIKNDGLISVHYENAPLTTVFKDIEAKTNFHFIYSKNDAEANSLRVDIHKKSATISQILQTVANQTGVRFQQSDNDISVRFPDRKALENRSKETGTIEGTVTDARSGETLPGANVYLKNNTIKGTPTDKKGRFNISNVKAGPHIIVASFVGYKKAKKKVTVQADKITTVNLVLQDSTSNIKSMVVTGVVKRSKVSFTGTAATYSSKEIEAVGNNNLIQSLKAIDPSFVVITNNKFGSDPNHLPNIEVRGQTSTPQNAVENQFGGNPNQPLFILDGFQTSLQTIINLDIDRIKSVTILKDASSTALYGAKAANGVVVVKTKEPKYGKVRVSYSNDMRIQIPDLSSYNLMNSKQKLEFEKKAGYYTDPGDVQGNTNYEHQVYLDSVYNARLIMADRGVNTDWLHIPVQTGITQSHSLNVSGGEEVIRYSLGANYHDINGVMKGSGRKKWGANMELLYGRGKLHAKDIMYVNGFKAINSHYGSFAKYARAVPYFQKTNKDGEITRYLDQTSLRGGQQDTSVGNPLYNANLNSKNNQKQLNIRNNLQIKYDFNNAFRLQGALEIQKGNTDGITYMPPLNTQFDDDEQFERGSYTEVQSKDFSYSGNIMFTYANVFKKRNRLTFNLRGEVQNNQNNRVGNTAVGFPVGSIGNPAFAFGYDPNSHPLTAQRTFRRSSLLATTNYSYDERYLFDFTFRMDGATAFGSAREYSPFWAVGIGWNLQNEHFFNVESINTLRLKANIGIVGNQNFGNVTSVSVYKYQEDTNIFGQGISVESLGNPNLKYQKTQNTSLTLDLVMFDDRINATLSAYQKITDPLVVVVDNPSSTGSHGLPQNVGNLTTKGLETNIKIRPIRPSYQRDKRLVWTVGIQGNFIRSRYGGFGNLINSLNKEQIQNSSLIRYKNGYSPDDIWVVRSLGIDPGTGKEVYLNSKGEPTFHYNLKDERAIGNKRPTVQGVLSNELRVRNFIFGFNIRFSFGGDLLNTALYNKVENIGLSQIGENMDLRALTERWQKPGDVSKFKAINNSSYTPISSRFVQENNFISGESMRIGYDVTHAAWLDKIGFRRIQFSIYMNDFFRISSVRAERGIDYPFSRAVSTSLKISF